MPFSSYTCEPKDIPMDISYLFAGLEFDFLRLTSFWVKLYARKPMKMLMDKDVEQLDW